MPARRYRAGEDIRDLCRACKTVRDHTVIAVDASGNAARVQCDFCDSQHNYRGVADEEPRRERVALRPRPAAATAPRLGPRPEAQEEPPALRVGAPTGAPSPDDQRQHHPLPAPRAWHAEAAPPERNAHVESDDLRNLEALLRRIVREELGLTPGLPAPKWRGGEVVLRPGKAGLQEKSWPVDALFHKIVMIRNRLRTLEQQLNVAEVPEDLKLRLQAYVSACYGSLTSFNVLFADEADQFKGGAGD